MSSVECCLWPRACQEDGFCWMEENRRAEREYYAMIREKRELANPPRRRRRSSRPS